MNNSQTNPTGEERKEIYSPPVIETNIVQIEHSMAVRSGTIKVDETKVNVEDWIDEKTQHGSDIEF
ncbi:hypothetical protein [Massilibacteroides sp.]|uniref:hypothetical protein n=1 Tax=Massilibacteroides sp. TaxID=2034766 RepID=UPI002612906F|nr:hypothetical protein [Massilibacteroides sp.]MDD4514775.1 hypothetical protein [Massilibacteroides sp.]